MAQDGTTAGGASYTIDNVTFPVGRTKLQSIFNAIRSTNIGNTAPDLVAGQFWIDNNTPSTTVWTMYFYDGTDNISFATIDTTANTVNFIDSTVVTELVNDLSPQLGGNLDLNSNNITGTGDLNFTGSITLTGNVDGRDVSTDGTKLDGIATNATANPNAIDNVVEDLSPQLGGTLDTNGNLIQFGDSASATDDRLQFGASQDLEIYHDGSNSYIKDGGTGNLLIQGDNLLLKRGDGTQTYIQCLTGGAVQLRHANSTKLETTSTGATVTGTLTATSFSGDGSGLTNITVTETDPNAIAFAIALG